MRKKKIIATVVLCILFIVFVVTTTDAKEPNQPVAITENGGVVFYGTTFNEVAKMAEENALKSDKSPLVWVILSCNDQENIKVYWFDSVANEKLQNLINNLEDDVDFYQVSQVIVNDELDAVKKAFNKDSIAALRYTIQPIPTMTAYQDFMPKKFPHYWNIGSQNDKAFILNVGVGTNNP